MESTYRSEMPDRQFRDGSVEARDLRLFVDETLERSIHRDAELAGFVGEAVFDFG